MGVVEMVAEWNAGERGERLQSELRRGNGSRDLSTAHLTGRPRHRLLRLSFKRLPDHGQLLLWHTEVEAEHIATAAALAGLSIAEADRELERAYSRLRVETRQAHLDLATGSDCRRYNRLIEVYVQARGRKPLPDVEKHLKECAYCLAAASQLDQTSERLPLLLAEAILGYGAAGYLSARRNPSASVPAFAAPAWQSPIPDSPGPHHPATGGRPMRSEVARRQNPPRLRLLAYGGIGLALLLASLLVVTLARPR